VLLVGSVPLGSSRAVFEAVGTKLGKLIKRIPDGETGARKDWIVWQADVFKNAKGPEPGSTRELQGGYHFILYKVKPGKPSNLVRWDMLRRRSSPTTISSGPVPMVRFHPAHAFRSVCPRRSRW